MCVWTNYVPQRYKYQSTLLRNKKNAEYEESSVTKEVPNYLTYSNVVGIF